MTAMGDVQLAEEDVIGLFGHGVLERLALNDHAALREADLLPKLGHLGALSLVAPMTVVVTHFVRRSAYVSLLLGDLVASTIRCRAGFPRAPLRLVAIKPWASRSKVWRWNRQCRHSGEPHGNVWPGFLGSGAPSTTKSSAEKKLDGRGTVQD